MHRLQAAIMRGATEIDVEFFDGTCEEAFLEAVRRNVAHGKPLTVAEREKALDRLLLTHYSLSDRALAEICGLSSKTVGVLRRRAAADLPHLNKRIGRDGKMHPVDTSSGRRHAARIFRERPDATVREVARETGIAPATASDVRDRLQRGESPYTRRARPNGGATGSKAAAAATGAPSVAIDVVEKDQALTSTMAGQAFVGWLSDRAIERDDWCEFVESIPLSRAYVIARIARQCAGAWTEFAEALERRPLRR